MLTEGGLLLLQPLRLLPDWGVAKEDADPRGMAVFDWRWEEVGVVRDVWVDRGIKVLRILEVELKPGLADGPGWCRSTIPRSRSVPARSASRRCASTSSPTSRARPAPTGSPARRMSG